MLLTPLKASTEHDLRGMFAEAPLGACPGHSCLKLTSTKRYVMPVLHMTQVNFGTVWRPTSSSSGQGKHCLELHSVHAAGSPEAKGKADYVLELVDNISTWHNMTVGMLTLWRTVLERPSPSQQILHEVSRQQVTAV